VRLKLSTPDPFGGARSSEPDEEDEDDEAPAVKKPARKTAARRK
jgi:ribosome-associated protein